MYTLKNKSIKKKTFGIIGLGLLVYSAITVIVVSRKVYISVLLRIGAGSLFLIFAFLLVYSLFLELPFVKTYGKKKFNDELVDTGTYALCRHPGVLWFGFVFFFLSITTGAQLLFAAGVVWTGLDVLHIYLQEKLFFPKMFPKYKEYINTTPMLLPTKESIKKCLTTMKFRELV